MIGAIITGVSSLLLGILLSALSISFIRGKSIELIAGYSSLSDDEKKQFELNRTARSNGKTLLTVSVLMIIFSCITFLYAFDKLTLGAYIALTVFFILSFFITVIGSVILLIIKNNN